MKSAYGRFALTIGVNTVVMFFLTYTLIDTTGHLYPNLNRFYMALVMVAAMVVLMMFFMRDMYDNERVNRAVLLGGVVVFLVVFGLARSQTFVGNESFLRSMIPHHSSAILMCEHSTITDPEIISLCEDIVEAQKREIAQMQEMLNRY